MRRERLDLDERAKLRLGRVGHVVGFLWGCGQASGYGRAVDVIGNAVELGAVCPPIANATAPSA